jgi:glutamate synthase domain-containing protein 1
LSSTEGSRPRWTGLPPKQGLYDPAFEHDACGVGFVVDIKGRKSHRILQQGLQVLVNLDHRGACGAEEDSGDGAGVLVQMPLMGAKTEAAIREFQSLFGLAETGAVDQAVYAKMKEIGLID